MNFRKEIEAHNYVRNFDVTMRRKDGTLLLAVESSFAKRDNSGNIERYQGFVLDMTEKRRAEDEIRRRNRELNALNAMAVVAAPVMLLVLIYFGYALVVWRQREGDEEDGPPLHETIDEGEVICVDRRLGPEIDGRHAPVRRTDRTDKLIFAVEFDAIGKHTTDPCGNRRRQGLAIGASLRRLQAAERRHDQHRRVGILA